MINLPTRAVYYKGGVTMVSRQDDPTYQCTSCYKPWFDNEVPAGLAIMQPECPACGSKLRKLTKDNPLITR